MNPGSSHSGLGAAPEPGWLPVLGALQSLGFGLRQEAAGGLFVALVFPRRGEGQELPLEAARTFLSCLARLRRNVGNGDFPQG